MALTIDNNQNSSSIINITLGILELKCLSFSLTDYGISNKSPIADDKYEFAFTFNLSFIEPLKEARVIVNSKLLEKKNETVKMVLAEMNVTSLFRVSNYDELIIKDISAQTTQIPNPLIQIINSTTMGGLRGMYCAKLENTIYSNALLPLIDPKVLIPPQITNM